MILRTKLRKELTQLVKTTIWLGFDYPDGNFHAPVLFYTITLVFLTINSGMYVIYKWDDPNNRVNGLKGLVVYVMCLIYLGTFLINWKNSMLLMKIVENGIYLYPYQFSTERLEKEHSVYEGMVSLNTLWYNAVTGYTIMVVIAPLTVFLVRITQYEISVITVDMLYIAYPFYYPEGYENLYFFFLAVLLQSFFFIYGIRTGYLAIVSAFASMQLVEGELKLIQLSVEEMDEVMQNNYTGIVTSQTKFALKIEVTTFLSYLIKHHQNIYRKASDVTKGIKMVAFGLNSGLSMSLCTVIYTLVKKDEIMLKLQETVTCFFIIFCFYCYDLMGENVSTEDENLRKTLYQMSWIDKPKHFKKSLLIMMARTNRQVEIKSTGLFVLNLKNFLQTVQAAYSYYNVLNNLKS